MASAIAAGSAVSRPAGQSSAIRCAPIMRSTGSLKRQPQLLAEMVAQRTTFICDIVDAALVDVEVLGAAAAADGRGQRRTIGNTARVVGFAKIGIERRGHLGGQRVCLRQLRRIGGFAEPLR